MKKIIIALILLLLSAGAFSCGGGAGSADTPKGENSGTPSVVQLSPSHFVAQTNTLITLHTKVLDGNGAPVPHVTVRFTNLSPVGVLSSASAKTNDAGIATVTLKSTTEGFSTIQTEVNKDVGQARDRKTVFFSSINVGQPAPTLDLTIGPGDPFTGVTVTATVFDGFGRLVAGISVLFDSDSSEATFPLGNTAITDLNGQASVLLKVVPSALRPLPTTINIMALASNGAFNMVSLTLPPVIISNVQVFANPQTVDSGGTSTITATVTTSAGTLAPDGTTVNFKVTQGTGGIDPFAQTTDGIATAEFKAPPLPEGGSNEIDRITATVGSVTSSPATVTVIAPAAPTPPPVEDTTPPTVSSTNPVNNGTLDISDAGGNPVPVSITFSENIDCSTVTTATITITPSVADWTLTSCSGPNVVFRGTLTAPSYSVNVGTGVKDLAGNVAVALVFTFTVVP